ncbi:MAG: TRAP transporter large permease subunit [Propionibacteriales bacterium]|nr:TRAP transporter large permease subunit [Propionibacteriales bacterium]
MEPTTVILLVVLLLFVLLAFGVHIGVALGTSGILGLVLLLGVQGAMVNVQSLPYGTTALYTLAIVPMFILMGSFFSEAGFTRDAFQAAEAWLGRLRGGMAAATVVACAAFGAVTGSSVANAAVFSRIALPEMVDRGIDKRLAAGVVAAAGTLASLIPPSLLLVIFAIITEQSVRLLLIAGFLPGIVSVLMFIASIILRVTLNPSLIGRETASLGRGKDREPKLPQYSWGNRFKSLRNVWSFIAVFGVVMGGIYVGWFTPTQAGAVGATTALLLGFLPGRNIIGRKLWESLKSTGATTCAILMILVGGTFMARFLGHSGAVRDLSDFLLGLAMPPIFYFLVYCVLVLILGMFLEAFAILVLVLPLMYPILTDVGYHPIFIGIMTIKLIEIGLITPPVGLNVYVVRSASPIPLSQREAFGGIYPFIAAELITIIVLYLFPQLILFVPNLVE